jgi:hypothetical protein
MRDCSVDYFAVMNSPFKSRQIKDAGTEPISWVTGDESIVCFAARRKTMMNRSVLTLIALVRRFYDDQMEKAQMRFAPTNCHDAPPPRH